MRPGSVQIVHRGMPGNTIPVEIRPGVAGIFTTTHAEGAVVTSASPARAGELLVVWVTGLGGGEQPLVAGVASPMPPIRTKGTVTARIGGLSSKVI